MGSSFEGMEGMEGMVGGLNAAIGGAGGPFFADRVDLPFVTADSVPGEPIAEEPPITIAAFPQRNWGPEWYAELVLTQFSSTGWAALANDLWHSFAVGVAGPPAFNVWNSPEAMVKVNAELADLVVAAQDERPSALGEILGQIDGFGSYFLDLLTATTGYPATARVLTIANTIGGFCAIYYKGLFQRPRATMLEPALMPPIPVPGHASFPSGHSTQAHLMALCMDEVFGGSARAPTMKANMKALAHRIARNREIAGLHYQSDSKAGRVLAHKVHDLLTNQTATDAAGKPTPTWYQQAIIAAKAEWP